MLGRDVVRRRRAETVVGRRADHVHPLRRDTESRDEVLSDRGGEDLEGGRRADEFEARPIAAALTDVDELGCGVACRNEVVHGDREHEVTRVGLRWPDGARFDRKIERRKGVEDARPRTDRVRRAAVGDFARGDQLLDRAGWRQIGIEQVGPDQIGSQSFDCEGPVRGVAADAVGA